MANKEFANKLKYLRQNAGLTQKQVYDFLGIPQSTFSSWEIGKSEPSADVLLQLCKLYKVDNILSAFGYDGLDESGLVKPNYPELQIIEKYRTLDNYGKDMVDMVLQKESNRCENLPERKTVTKLNKSYLEPIAAHNDNLTSEQIDLMREDLDEL